MYCVSSFPSFEELEKFISEANKQKHVIVGFVKEALGYTVIYKKHKPAEYI
jgi:hypothetical protein